MDLHEHYTMSSAEDRSFYGDALPVLEDAIALFDMRLDAYRAQAAVQTGHDPVHTRYARIKSAQSMREKLMRNGLCPTRENALTKLYDAAGVRIVCSFIDDVDEVADAICALPDYVCAARKDYIRAPKANGYRSYHVILRTASVAPDTQIPLHIEVQIRTIAMESWASIEHELKYKRHIAQEPLIIHELKRCANEIAATDLALQTLRDLIHAG